MRELPRGRASGSRTTFVPLRVRTFPHPAFGHPLPGRERADARTGSRSALGFLLLVLRLEALHDRRVGERGGIAESAAFCDVAEEPPHDLPAPRLRQLGGED